MACLACIPFPGVCATTVSKIKSVLVKLTFWEHGEEDDNVSSAEEK